MEMKPEQKQEETGYEKFLKLSNLNDLKGRLRWNNLKGIISITIILFHFMLNQDENKSFASDIESLSRVRQLIIKNR